MTLTTHHRTDGAIEREFSGKVVVVTGAAQGIGRTVVEAFGARGARVVAIDNNADALAKLGRLVDDGLDVVTVPLDVSDSRAVETAVATIERERGPVEVLANVAGVLVLGPITELTDAEWSRAFSVNTDGVFFLARSVARRMVGRRRGAIVTVASNAAQVPRMQMAAYAASKAATTSLMKCLGLELAGYGIRCNIVSPGSTDTPMLRGMWTDDAGPRATLHGSLEQYRVGIPLRKLASTADVAEAVLFLASERAGHITMQDLQVDGGAALGN
ncbi:2,3-dihydro-2,3-dihydroxybenzoate dehydrogenase [Micromonospora sp. NPDC093277]|uniref:2,3-dihydro-2,3-dihydroxybenzoate dehydrogenase n=1 Tax=Micromonospora sp. NPDC093277 TaxID=3364291 RepID=UPI00381D489A